jgi:ABC-2 type transport system permease protein
MKAQIASEFRKLTTTRSAFWLLAGLLLVVGIGAAGIINDEVGRNATVAIERQPFLLLPLMLSMTFTMILGIRSFTDEFRHGSIVPTLLASPDRRRVLGAKVVTVGGAAVVYAVLAFGVALAVGAVGLAAKGAHVTWSIGPLAAMGGSLVVASVLWAAIGVGVGVAVRHQVAAIVGALLWTLVGESAIDALLPDVGGYLPGSAGSAIVGVDAANLLAPGVAVAVLAGWTVLATVVGAQLMQRRDIA